MYKFIVSMVMFLGLMGCQGGMSSSSKNGAGVANTRYELLSRGYSVDYVDAYELGCASVADKNVAKDGARYSSNSEYKRGWEQGVATCQNPYGAISRQVIEQKKKTSSGSQLWKEMKK